MTLTSLRIAADRQEVEKLQPFVEQSLQPLGVDTDVVYDVLVALHEIVTNSIVHGYRGQPGEIEIAMWVADDALVVQIRDGAPVFDPTQVDAPDLSVPLAERPPGGMGIHLVRQFVDSIRHRALPAGGNELTLIKQGVFSGNPTSR